MRWLGRVLQDDSCFLFFSSLETCRGAWTRILRTPLGLSVFDKLNPAFAKRFGLLLYKAAPFNDCFVEFESIGARRVRQRPPFGAVANLLRAVVSWIKRRRNRKASTATVYIRTCWILVTVFLFAFGGVE